MTNQLLTISLFLRTRRLINHFNGAESDACRRCPMQGQGDRLHNGTDFGASSKWIPGPRAALNAPSRRSAFWQTLRCFSLLFPRSIKRRMFECWRTSVRVPQRLTKTDPNRKIGIYVFYLVLHDDISGPSFSWHWCTFQGRGKSWVVWHIEAGSPVPSLSKVCVPK